MVLHLSIDVGFLCAALIRQRCARKSLEEEEAK